MKSSRFLVRVLLSYSYLVIGFLLFGAIITLLPGLILHPLIVLSSIGFIAGWIWVAKTYLGFANSARHKQESIS